MNAAAAARPTPRITCLPPAAESVAPRAFSIRIRHNTYKRYSSSSMPHRPVLQVCAWPILACHGAHDEVAYYRHAHHGNSSIILTRHWYRMINKTAAGNMQAEIMVLPTFSTLRLYSPRRINNTTSINASRHILLMRYFVRGIFNMSQSLKILPEK